MKHSVRQYPAILLFLFLVFSSIQGHTVATSIVVLSLCALSAYRAYLDKIETPDPSVAIRKEIENLRRQLEQDRSELTKVKEDFSKVSLSVTRGGFSGQQIRF